MKNRVSCYNNFKKKDLKDIAFYKYPENALLPEDQVDIANSIVVNSAKTGRTFAVVTVSPYILKAIAVKCDLLEQEVEFVDEHGNVIELETLFKSFSVPFAKLVHGENWKPTDH